MEGAKSLVVTWIWQGWLSSTHAVAVGLYENQRPLNLFYWKVYELIDCNFLDYHPQFHFNLSLKSKLKKIPYPEKNFLSKADFRFFIHCGGFTCVNQIKILSNIKILNYQAGARSLRVKSLEKGQNKAYPDSERVRIKTW